MPVKVLGLEVERKSVGQRRVERGRNPVHRGLGQISGCIEIGGYFFGLVVGFAHGAPCCRKTGNWRHWTLPAGPSNASAPSRFPRPAPRFAGLFPPWTNGSIITIPRI